MTALVIIEGIVIALLVVVVAGLLRSHAEILRRLHALGAGEDETRRSPGGGLSVGPRRDGSVPAEVSGPTPDGETRSVALDRSRGLVLLAFLTTGCSTCRPFWEAFAARVEMPGPEVRPVIVTKAESESRSRLVELAPPGSLTIMSEEAWDAFRIPVAPYFVLVDAARGRVVGEGAAGSWDHVRDLLARAMADAGLGGGSTAQRGNRIDHDLASAGVDPEDPSLYRNPHHEP